jgi:hypothetical protein
MTALEFLMNKQSGILETITNGASQLRSEYPQSMESRNQQMAKNLGIPYGGDSVATKMNRFVSNNLAKMREDLSEPDYPEDELIGFKTTGSLFNANRR